MDIILIAGLWLDGSAWDAVVPALRDAGHRPIALTLPGQDDRPDGVTLNDQLTAVLTAIDAAEAPVAVIGHSAGCTLAWLAADRRPDRVASVTMVGGFPQAEGQQFAPFFEVRDGVMPFPGWEPFAGPDSDDLDADARASIEAGAHAAPGGVVHAAVHYTDPSRHDLRVVLVCPEYSPDDAREWIEAGEVPELAAARHVRYLDLESGHWPMISNPHALAAALLDAVG